MGRSGRAEVIVVDTSALLAILYQEPERERMLRLLSTCEVAYVSAATVIEARMVVHGRHGRAGVVFLNELLTLRCFQIVSLQPDDVDVAYAAFVAYGRGSGHSAALNFGDLFSYALAKCKDLPLLFKGDDFKSTDLARALAR
jgi:ribonuclease VapC